MKVLTIKEPWASLILNKYKEYEFRTWKTNYRGKILIHSSKSVDKEELNNFNDLNIDYSNGEIIAIAEITDCILVDERFDKELKSKNNLVYKHNHINQYAWKLENVKPVKRIKINGKLGLWNYEGEIK